MDNHSSIYTNKKVIEILQKIDAYRQHREVSIGIFAQAKESLLKLHDISFGWYSLSLLKLY